MPATDNPIAALVEAAREARDWFREFLPVSEHAERDCNSLCGPSCQLRRKLKAALAAVAAMKPVGWRCERGHRRDRWEAACGAYHAVPNAFDGLDDFYCRAPVVGLVEMP